MIIDRPASDRARREAGSQQPGLSTERLDLTPLVHADAFEFAVLGGVVEVASMTGHIPYPLTIRGAEEWIAELPSDGRDRSVMAVRCRDTNGGKARCGELVGVCGYAPDHSGLHAIGYFVGTRHWGSGYATEAARAMIGRCFKMTETAGITANHFTENRASARVLQKLGFSLVGPGRCWCGVREQDLETMSYVFTRSDYEAMRAREPASRGARPTEGNP